MSDVTEYKVLKNTQFEVLTDQGFKPFKGLIVGKNQHKLRITFDTETELVCTPKHKLIDTNYQWIFAKDVTIGQMLYGGLKVARIESFQNDQPMYDLLHVADNHRYFANGVLSHQCIVLDELAFVQPQVIEEFWNSVMPVISSSKNTQIFIVSTPNGTQNKFYEIYSGAERGDNGWKAERVDWWEVPGRDAAWKVNMIQTLGDQEKFDQEFGNKFVEVGSSPFAKGVFDMLREMVRPPLLRFVDSVSTFEPAMEDETRTVTYKIWEIPDPEHVYAIGVDVAEGVGRAASVVSVIDITDLADIRLVAQYHSRYVQPAHFALRIVDIAYQYGQPLVLCERNKDGGQVIDELMKKHNYTRVVNYDPTNSNMKYYTRTGIYSHTNSKYKGVSNMRYWFDSLQVVKVFDIATIQEFETFIRHPNGTWGRMKIERIFDDRVDSIIWALFVLEPDIAEQYLEVAAYDETGRPRIVKDPNAMFVSSDHFTNQGGHYTNNRPLPTALLPQLDTPMFDQEISMMLANGWSIEPVNMNNGQF